MYVCVTPASGEIPQPSYFEIIEKGIFFLCFSLSHGKVKLKWVRVSPAGLGPLARVTLREKYYFPTYFQFLKK